MKILGLHNSLESSVSLFLNGKIVSAVSEERFKRIKNYRGFPSKALKYTLEKYKLNLTDFDFIVYGIVEKIYPEEDIKDKFEKKIKETPKKFHKKFFQRVKTEIDWNKRYIKRIKQFASKNNILDKLVFIDHHESHAASAYFCSPFKNAYIFTLDGKGGFRSGSYYIGQKTNFQT